MRSIVYYSLLGSGERIVMSRCVGIGYLISSNPDLPRGFNDFMYAAERT